MDTNDEWIRSRVGIASRRIAGPDETVVGHGRGRRRQGAGGQRAGAGRHRPRHRRHLHDADARSRTRPPRSPPGSASPRPARTTSTPPAPASATRWPRPPRAITAGAAAQRARGRLGEALRLDRLDRPVHLHHLRRRRRRRGGRPGRVRERGRASARWSGAAPATSVDTDHDRGPDPVPRAGGPGGLPLGHHRAGPGRAGGLRAGRRRPDRAGRVRPAPGQPAHHRGDRPQARRARTRGSPTTSSSPATPPSASIPLALAQMVERGEVPLRRTRCCCSASAPAYLRRSGRPLPVTTARSTDPTSRTDITPTKETAVANEEITRRPRRDPRGGRRRAAGRRHRGEVVHRRPRRRLAVHGRDRGGRRGEVRREDPGRRAAPTSRPSATPSPTSRRPRLHERARAPAGERGATRASRWRSRPAACPRSGTVSERPTVVVTGLGATTPLGGDVASTWEGMLAGRSGVDAGSTEDWAARLPGPDRRPAGGRADRGARPGRGPPAGPLPAGRADRRPRGLGRRRLRPGAKSKDGCPTRPSRVDPERLAVVIGSGIGGALTLLGQDDILEAARPAPGLPAHRADAHAQRPGRVRRPGARRPGRRARAGQRLRHRRRGDRARPAT